MAKSPRRYSYVLSNIFFSPSHEPHASALHIPIHPISLLSRPQLHPFLELLISPPPSSVPLSTPFRFHFCFIFLLRSFHSPSHFFFLSASTHFILIPLPDNITLPLPSHNEHDKFSPICVMTPSLPWPRLDMVGGEGKESPETHFPTNEQASAACPLPRTELFRLARAAGWL